MTNASTKTRSRARWISWAQLVALVGLGIAANLVVELSVLATLLILIVALSLRPSSRRLKRLSLIVIIAAGVGAAIGLVRFSLSKAITGIAQGGQQAASSSALYRLREVLLAEDALRKEAPVDSDRDGIGEAEFIRVLAGLDASRNGNKLSPPVLNYRFREAVVDTALGPAVRVASHLFIVCLPTRGGGWTAKDAKVVDPEAAERRFVAYAWPTDRARDISDVWFLDEHENILLLKQPGHGFHGSTAPPPCDAALGDSKGRWIRWKHKTPRHRLPGDSAK